MRKRRSISGTFFYNISKPDFINISILLAIDRVWLLLCVAWSTSMECDDRPWSECMLFAPVFLFLLIVYMQDMYGATKSFISFIFIYNQMSSVYKWVHWPLSIPLGDGDELGIYKIERRNSLSTILHSSDHGTLRTLHIRARSHMHA